MPGLENILYILNWELKQDVNNHVWLIVKPGACMEDRIKYSTAMYAVICWLLRIYTLSYNLEKF